MICIKCELYFKNSGAGKVHEMSCKLTKSSILNLRNDYINGSSIVKLSLKYNCSKSLICTIIKDIARTQSESLILAHKLHPDKFKTTEETKIKQRKSRLKWLKENPDKTAWRSSNISYPEKLFSEKIIKLGLDKNYFIVRERSVFPYFIDFAFENEKVAIEIDGSQHELLERRMKDNKKDECLKINGWRVYRVRANQVLNNIDYVINDIIDFIGENKSEKKCGLYVGKTLNQLEKESLKIKRENERIENKGLTNAELYRSLNQRKVTRPSYDILLKEVDFFGYEGTGRKYKVSGNCIKKWIRIYKKYG